LGYLATNYSKYANLNEKKPFLYSLILSQTFSILGFFGTYYLIPIFKEMTLKAGLFGIDINKCVNYKDEKDPDRKIIPESLGIVPGFTYLAVSITSQIFMKLTIVQQLEFNAALLSICFMILLGFSDDVLDLRWRYKLILPFVASLPIIFAYGGATNIVFPKFISNIIGIKILELGILFKVYMCLLAIFCTNSINILAGINGLEVGQSLIIAATIILYNLIEILNQGEEKLFENVFSLSIVLPFFFCSLALFIFNKYPSQVFIGDTYTYFAGMTFACAGILGHFSKTLLFFFIPQILNFLYSFPQLIGIFHCPRHRLAQYDPKTKKLTGKKENMNLLNLFLIILGPQREQDICFIIIMFQIICNGIALFVRLSLFKL
jgi:UDP-N-acetylglucosamine--dolichyl-phosphate N-acetylglucosaminephosphotransferase